jgi:hypothetical protein
MPKRVVSSTIRNESDSPKMDEPGVGDGVQISAPFFWGWTRATVSAICREFLEYRGFFVVGTAGSGLKGVGSRDLGIGKRFM